MKIKCIKLLNSDGQDIENSPWLTTGKIYHVMAINFSPEGRCHYSIITSHRHGEWPDMGGHLSECFEIVSTTIPSNWRFWIGRDGEMGVAPLAWQGINFYEGFYDHDPATYPIFEREHDLILNEDP